MSESSFLIREIEPEDNARIEAIIKAIFPEYGLPIVGSAYEDIETSRMFQSYQGTNKIYFIIEENGIVVGGAGIMPLRNSESHICELQKMYFAPQIRGKGYGKIMFEKCLKTAKEMGYTQCYLESASQLKAAIHIYESNGFKHLDAPMGSTGHLICGVWMLKDL